MDYIYNKTIPKDGLSYLTSNISELTRTTRKLCFICPICGISFLKPAAWARRTNNHYCSRACAAEGQKIRVITHCTVCNKQMEQTPSDAVRVVTCSKDCSSIRRRSVNGCDPTKTRKVNFALYTNKVKEIAQISKCVNCGVDHGPWAVRGISIKIDENLLPCIDDEHAELWCRRCHLQDMAKTAVDKRMWRPTKKAPKVSQ